VLCVVLLQTQLCQKPSLSRDDSEAHWIATVLDQKFIMRIGDNIEARRSSRIARLPDMESIPSPSSVNTPTPSDRHSSRSTPSDQAIMSKDRYEQLQHVSNHQMCLQRNQQALLTERMNQLGALVKELEETDWMFEKKNDESGPISFNKGIEERW
jgi:hypothetical protein